MDYRIQRLKEELTNANRRNKHQKKQLADITNAYLKIKEINNNLGEQIEKLQDDVDFWKEKYTDLLKDLCKNYERISLAEQHEVNDRDFIEMI